MSTKLFAMYTKPADEAAFLEHYRTVHLPLVHAIPGLESATMNIIDANVMGGDAPYYMITEMVFPDKATFDAAMASPENRAAGKDVMGFAKGLVTLVTASIDNG